MNEESAAERAARKAEADGCPEKCSVNRSDGECFHENS
jgi:hypothetical protein